VLDDFPRKRGWTAWGVRRGKFIPFLFGLLGMGVATILCIRFGILSIVSDTTGVVNDIAIAGVLAFQVGGLLVGFGGYTLLNLRTRSYALLEDRVEMHEGFLKHEAKTVPYDQITNVVLRKGIWERQFGAGTVKIRTAGSDRDTLWLRGIDDPDRVAEFIQERVRKTESTGGRTDAE